MTKPRRRLRNALLAAVGLLIASFVLLSLWEDHIAPLEDHQRRLDLQLYEARYVHAHRDERLRERQGRADRLRQLQADLTACPSGATAAPEAPVGGSPGTVPAVQPVQLSTSSEDTAGLPGALAQPCIAARAARVRHYGTQAQVTWTVEAAPRPATPPDPSALLGDLPSGSWMHPVLSAKVRAQQEELRQLRASLPPEVVADEQDLHRVQPLFNWLQETREVNALAGEALALLREEPALDGELEVQRRELRRDLLPIEALKEMLAFSSWQLAAVSAASKPALVARLRAKGFEVKEEEGEGEVRLVAVKPRPAFR